MVILDVTGQVGVLHTGGARYLDSVPLDIPIARPLEYACGENRVIKRKRLNRDNESGRKCRKLFIKRVWEVKKWFKIGCEELPQITC